MTFKLTEKGRTRINTVFHITNSEGDICGSINMPNEAASDLLKHWRDSVPAAAAAAGKQARSANTMVGGPSARSAAITGGDFARLLTLWAIPASAR